jgi:membrane fusion protein, multidrug efflux system
MTKPLVFEAWPLCIADRLTRIAERSTPLRILPVPRNSWHHRRYSELVAKGATPQLTVDNFKTQGDTLWAAIRADNAALENLKVQLSFCFIRAPITGRILRVAMAESDTSVEAIIPGETRRARGTIAMIENAVDPTTGMATVRASMPNEDELLWPGTLVTAHR